MKPVAPKPEKRQIQLGNKVYELDGFPQICAQKLNGVIIYEPLDEADSNGNDTVFKLSSMVKVSDALEAFSELVIPELITDGFVKALPNGRYRFEKEEEYCILLFLQLLTIQLVDNIKESEHTEEDYQLLEATKTALLKSLDAIGYGKYYPDYFPQNEKAESQKLDSVEIDVGGGNPAPVVTKPSQRSRKTSKRLIKT